MFFPIQARDLGVRGPAVEDVGGFDQEFGTPGPAAFGDFAAAVEVGAGEVEACEGLLVWGTGELGAENEEGLEG